MDNLQLEHLLDLELKLELGEWMLGLHSHRRLLVIVETVELGPWRRSMYQRHGRTDSFLRIENLMRLLILRCRTGF